MILKPKTNVYIIVPPKKIISKDRYLTADVTFNVKKQIFTVYSFDVHSNAKLYQITSVLSKCDLQHGLRVGNYGIIFFSTNI